MNIIKSQHNKLIYLFFHFVLNCLVLTVVFFFYLKYDAGLYKCSTQTHIAGFLIPITFLINTSLKQTCKSYLTFIADLFALSLAYGMLWFHIMYEIDKNNLLTSIN